MTGSDYYALYRYAVGRLKGGERDQRHPTGRGTVVCCLAWVDDGWACSLILSSEVWGGSYTTGLFATVERRREGEGVGEGRRPKTGGANQPEHTVKSVRAAPLTMQFRQNKRSI